jgi:hypothetical protein
MTPFTASRASCRGLSVRLSSLGASDHLAGVERSGVSPVLFIHTTT